MDRGKIVAVITGVISIMLAVAYLILVQILDFRGEMKPAPITQIEPQNMVVAFDGWQNNAEIHVEKS
ncbi:hypothetical protein Riv7116_3734 [Rivularia sp. PCC 7116]|uniref:hypothetical protein n=1 Tax=Rivularia sp. PCC 7116 TaxID=373994 RepID=UPI00029EEE93|nr:hypothetical protein [Rivularia sp. PCC 7116]AFY56179.1 hypothetical protein Riv7116_3734 [Rivularia sp. PCC 7116]